MINWAQGPSVRLKPLLCDTINSFIAGVLTKPDRIAAGDDREWTSLVTGADPHGRDTQWFVVKNPDSIALQRGVTWEESRQDEALYFANSPTWISLGEDYKDRLGTEHLVCKLSDLLSDLIVKKCVP
jgi:hypothetical protein